MFEREVSQLKQHCHPLTSRSRFSVSSLVIRIRTHPNPAMMPRAGPTMLSRKRKVTPGTMLKPELKSFATKGFSSQKYSKVIDEMLSSQFVTRVYCGQQLRSVICDGEIDEHDRELLIQLLDRQVATWNAVALVDTLLLSVVTGYAFADSSSWNDGEYTEFLSAAFDVAVTVTTVGFLFSTVITVLFLAYSACLSELDDLVWFLCTWRPELPITLCIISLIFMHFAGIAASLLAHGIGPVGIVTASLWGLCLIATRVMWVRMKSTFLKRWSSVDWQQRHAMATVMSTGSSTKTWRRRKLGGKSVASRIDSYAASANKAVESTINAAERTTGVDIDRDGDVGVPGRGNRDGQQAWSEF